MNRGVPQGPVGIPMIFLILCFQLGISFPETSSAFTAMQ